MPRPIHRVGVTLLALILVAALPSCSDSSTSPDNAPPGHTVLQDGVPHRPGLNDPLQNCTSCHGSNLQGGSEGQPSCTKCHGVKW
jgi:hypothetical protein